MDKVVGNANGIIEGVIWKQLIKFFFPILLGAFFQQLYNTVDAIIVGNFVGKTALASVGGSTGVLINLLVGFFVGLSSGASVIISQYYGAKKVQETSKSVHTSIALSIFGGFIIMIFGILFAPQALKLMSTPDDVLKYAVQYMRVYFAGIIPVFIYNVGSSILRAIGDSKRPLYFLIVCCFLNIILDLLFVVTFDMGVFGVALATLISQTISAVLVIIVLIKTDNIYKLTIKEIKFTKYILKDIVKIGLPAGLQSIMYSSSNIIIQSTLNSFGTNVIAGWTAYSKIDGMFWMTISAFGISITTFTGQNFGAKKYKRMSKSVKVCLIMASLTAVFLSIILMTFGTNILSLFTNDRVVVEKGFEIMKMMAPFYICYVCIEVLSGAVRGAGDSLIPMIMTCFGICVLRIFWVMLVVPYNKTISMVIANYPITWTITSIMFIVYYLQGSWFKRALKRQSATVEMT